MQKKLKFIKVTAIIVCAVFVALLIFSEAFAAEHDCVGENCVVCQFVQGVKLSIILAASVFALKTLSFAAPRFVCGFVRRDTLVSNKRKLTI